MRPFTQLLRQPVRTVIAIILLTASAAFMCLGWGVFRSAKATEDEIQESFVTLAMLGPSYNIGKNIRMKLDPETGEYVLDDVGEEVVRGTWDPQITKKEYFDTLESCPFVRNVYRHQFISAFVPELHTLTSASSGTKYWPEQDAPHNSAVLLIKLTEVQPQSYKSSIDFNGEQHMEAVSQIELKGEVVDCFALHPDLELRHHLEFSLTQIESQAQLDTILAELEVGETYIVNVNSYKDMDLAMRTQKISTNRFLFGDRGLTTDQLDTGTLRYDEELDHYVIDGTGGDIFILTDEELADVDSCYGVTPMYRYIDSALETKEDLLTIARVEDSVEEFLADPDNADWARLVENTNAQYDTVPIIGTDLLKSLFVFHENTAYITQGRNFTPSDCSEGKRVCIISESLAHANGLKVGDRLDLNLYNGRTDETFGKLLSEIRPQAYDGASGIQDTREYEIVGLYANTQEWKETNAVYNEATGEYDLVSTNGFSSNTIFVPNASLEGLETYTADSSLQSIVLKNGKEDEFKKFLAEKGWPEDLFVYFNGGYSEIKDTMEGFMDSPVQLLLVAAATFLVITAAYIALFVTRQRRNAGLMLSLGAGKRRAAGVVFVTSLIPAAIASVTGAALGALYLNRAVDSVFGEAVTGGEFAKLVRVEPESAISACLVMIFAYLMILGAASILMCRRRPLKLLKK